MLSYLRSGYCYIALQSMRGRVASAPYTPTLPPKLHLVLPLSPVIRQALPRTEARVYTRRRQSAEPARDVTMPASPDISPISTKPRQQSATHSTARRK